VVGAVAALVLAGCGSSGSGSSTAAGTSGGTGATGSSQSSGGASGSSSAAAGGAPTAVTVTATEFALALPSTNLSPGTYTFTMADAGHATHAIELQGPGVNAVKSDTAGPGGKASITVTLQPGTYDMWCPVGNHRAMGMETKLTVG
jgi:plastocyanin